MRCPSLSEGKLQNRGLMSAIWQIFMASCIGTTATMTTRHLQQWRQSLQGQARTIALSLGTCLIVQCSKQTAMISLHARRTCQQILRQGQTRHSMKQDMQQWRCDAAIPRWSNSSVVRLPKRASASATKAPSKASCIGLIARMMAKHMQASRRESLWHGLAFLPCALGLVALVKPAHLWATIVPGLGSQNLQRTAAELLAGR